MVQQAVSDFIEMLAAEKGVSLRTEEAYRRDIEQFLETEKITEPAQITPQKISDFLSFLAAQPRAQKTQARKLSALREFC